MRQKMDGDFMTKQMDFMSLFSNSFHVFCTPLYLQHESINAKSASLLNRYSSNSTLASTVYRVKKLLLRQNVS